MSLRHARLRGFLLVLAVATAVALLFALLIERSRLAAQERERTRATVGEVCRRVHRLDRALEGLVAASSSRKALLRTSYYRDHPGELDAAVAAGARNLEVLRRADCSAADFSPVNWTP